MITAVCFSNEHRFEPSKFHTNMLVCVWCGITKPNEQLIAEAAERIGAKAEIVTNGSQLCDDTEIEDEQYRADRKQQTQDFLSRMNSPEMVARRGTVLTPYGWQIPR